MSNHYTKVSLEMMLPDKEAQQQALALAAQAERIRDSEEEIPEGCPFSNNSLEGWYFDIEPEGERSLWIYVEEQANIDAICEFVHHLLKTYDPDGQVSFEWSRDCDRPFVGAYGGGAAIITAHEIKSMSTWEWINTNSKQS